MAVAILFSSARSHHQHSAFPVQRQYKDDLMQGLQSTLGVYPQSWPNPWLQDHDITHSSTQASSETSVYSNLTKSAHPIKTEADCYNHVQVKTETCSCDVCSRLFGGACHLLQFEENIRGDTSVAMETEYNPEENTLFTNTTPLRSDDEHLSKVTCKVCGEKLVEDQDICNISKELSFLSHDADKHSSETFCLTCLMNNVVTSIYEKCDMFDDVTDGIEYECSVCMAVFQSRTETHEHMNTHDRIQNHACPFCQKQFSNGKQFYSHFLTHDKEQEFTCRLCRKVFTCENKYRSHVKSHTVADASSKLHDDAGTGDIDKCKSAKDNMYSTTSCQDINVIRSCDVGARLQSGGDSSTDILYTDLVESVDASSKRDCDSNMASDDLPAVISYCEACDAASSNEREQDINLKSCRDLRFKANCSKQDRLAGSVGSLGGIVCLANDRMEISNFGKARVVKDRTKTEEDEYNHIEATNEEQEERKNGFMKASSNGKKGTESDQIIDNSGDQEGVDDARTEISNEEKDSERNIQIKHSSGSLGVQQQERNISDQKQNTRKLRDIKDGYEGHDVLPEDICMTENRSKEFNKQVETEKESEKEVCNLSWKKFNIDKSKKLHIRKTLVIPKTHPVSLTKRQTDGSNNELLIEEDHRKFTQQITTTAVEAKKPSHDKNKKKSSHDKNKKKPSYDKNNNLTSEKHKKWNDTEKNTIPSVTITSFCSGKDSNGNKTFVSNFLLAEQNQNQSSWKRHSSKRKRFKSDQRSKNIKRPDSSDTKSCNLTTMIKRRKYCSSVTSREHQSSSGSSLGRPNKFLEEESDASDKDSFFSSVRNPLLLVKDCQSEWHSDRKEEASSDNGSSSESTKSSDCNVGGSEDLEDFSGNPDSSPKPLKCKHCSKTFRRRFNLSRHMLIHEGNGPYQCDICNKNCQSRGDLVKHLTVHTGDHPFQCDICQKSFTQKVNLKRHMATHLDKDRDTPESLTNCFRCGICDKGFTQKTHMERHRRLHTGEKRYKCHICSEQFFESHHLKRHLMKHENGKIMKCTVCKKKFTRRLEYSRHLRTHNQFKDYRLYTCDTCDRGYDTRHGLVKHMLIHTGEKPFNCTVCNKSFRCKDSFREHNKGIKHKSRLLKFERRQ